MIKLSKIVFASIILAFLISCSQKQVLKKYYLLDYPVDQVAQTSDTTHFNTLPYSVRIEPFIISGPFGQNRIALRMNSNEVEYYYYHYWAQNPAAAIRYFIFKQVGQSALFKNCYVRASQSAPDYLLSGEIDAIERVNFKEKSFAHLAMSLELTNIKNNTLLTRHTFNRLRPIEKGAPMNTFARDISKILHAEINIFLNQVQSKLK